MVTSSRAAARWLILTALLSLVRPVWTQAQAALDAWDRSRYLTDFAALEGMAPRLEGSARERTALDYVRQRLADAGAPVRPISYAESQTVHSFSAGIEASVTGRSSDTLLIVIPMDHAVRAPAGSDGSAGIALGVAVVRGLMASKPAVSVRVLFLGAEHGSGPDYPIGSRRYLEGFLPDAGVAVLYLDLRSEPTSLQIRAGSNGIVSPRWLVEQTTDSLERAGLSFRLRGNESQLLRLGVASDSGAIAPFLNAGFPAIGMLDAPRPASRPGDPAREESDEFLPAFGRFVEGLTDALGKGVPEEWDRHYLLFQLGSGGFTVSERAYLVTLIALVAACLLYSVLSGRRGRRYAVAFLEGLWSLPIHLAFLFGLALVATLGIEALLAALDFPTLWQQAPLQLLLLKVLVGVSLFALLTPLVTRAPFPRSDTFHAATAVLLLVGVLAGTAAYEISLAYYLAWALALTLASVIARDRSAKILLFLMAPAWLLRAVIELFWLRELPFIRWVLLDRFWGNLSVVAAVAPFYFMTLRLRLLLPGRRRRRRRIIIVTAGLACLAAASATAAWIGYLRPYQDGDARPIAARAVFDYETGTGEIDLECPIAIREYTVVTRDSAVRTATGARRAKAPLDLVPAPLLVSTAGSAFLDRQNVVVTLAPAAGSELRPYRVTLRLVGDSDFVLFDASLPFLRDPSAREYAIRVGANPPSPLSVELTLPRGVGFELAITAEYLSFPQDIAVFSPGAVMEPWTQTRSVHRFRT